jgi:tRNA (guanine-N7-)-methyltransferase
METKRDVLPKLNSRMLPWPADWSALFGWARGAAHPLIVEVGFGHGGVLLDLARRNPNAGVIGLEIANRSLLKVESKIEQEGLTNVRVIHTMAETALHHLFTPTSIAQIHVNFPDPWFKAGHSHRRLIQRDTLDAMINRLAPGGTFSLATDILAYAEMSHELLAASPGLDNLLPAPWVNSMPDRAISKYEAAARREGRECYYFAYGRNHTPAPDVPVVEDAEMPHVVFSSPLNLGEMLARFEPHRHSDAGISVSMMNAYLGREALLIETHVGEPTITQNVALVIVKRLHPDTPGANEYTIQLSTLGMPRPTVGVHHAVKLLSEWVLSLHPDTRIIKQKVSAE